MAMKVWKIILPLLFLCAIILFFYNQESWTKRSSRATVEKEHKQEVQEPVKDKLPLLNEQEIKTIMGNFMKIEETVFQTFRSGNWTIKHKPQQVATELVESLPKSIYDIASEKFVKEKLFPVIEHWHHTLGESGLLPNVYFDARMEVVENTPSKITVKTFTLENDAGYTSSMNVYVTALKVNDKWLIDQYELVSVDDEPLHLMKEELIKYEENDLNSRVDFIAEDSLTCGGQKGLSKAYVIKVEKYGMVYARLAKTGDICFEIPEKYNEQLSQ